MSQPNPSAEAAQLMADLREQFPEASEDELQERFAEEVNQIIDEV